MPTISVYQIRTRHEFLKKLIGTKPLEDESFDQANEVFKTTNYCMMVFFIMETVMYFLYHYKVNIQYNILKALLVTILYHFCTSTFTPIPRLFLL